jgi:trypsin-like peptidase
MSTRHVALCTLLLAGCAPRSAPVAAGPVGVSGGAALVLPTTRDPHSVGTIVMLDVTFPEAGTRVGAQLAGAQYSQRVGDLRLTEAVRQRWAREARETGEAVLRGAGFAVRSLGTPSSDAQSVEGVRFGIAGLVVALQLDVMGRTEPVRIVANATVNWELQDFAAGRALLGRSLSGTATVSDSVEAAASLAVRHSFEALLADSSFLQALGTPRSSVEMIPAGGGFVRPIPGQHDTIVLTADDFDPSQDPEPVVRVAAAVVALRASNGTTTTGFLISRDGLTVTSGRITRGDGRRVTARFPSGVERSARVVRSGHRLALVQVSCPDPCRTVEPAPAAWPTKGRRVLAVGAPFQDGESYQVGRGKDSGACGLFSGPLHEMDLGAGMLGGEPVAHEGDGTVFAVMTLPGCALRLDAALRALGVVVQGP